MTSKERAQFRAMANSLEPEFHIGKGGLSEGVIKQTLDSFNTKELKEEQPLNAYFEIVFTLSGKASVLRLEQL